MQNLKKKNLVETINQIVSTEKVLELEWIENNLINLKGAFKNNQVQEIIENINVLNKELIISPSKHYRGIRTLQKQEVTISDLKLIDDILQNYPEYQIVIFDRVKTNTLSINLINLVKKYENVLFLKFERR